MSKASGTFYDKHVWCTDRGELWVVHLFVFLSWIEDRSWFYCHTDLNWFKIQKLLFVQWIWSITVLMLEADFKVHPRHCLRSFWAQLVLDGRLMSQAKCWFIPMYDSRFIYWSSEQKPDEKLDMDAGFSSLMDTAECLQPVWGWFQCSTIISTPKHMYCTSV